MKQVRRWRVIEWAKLDKSWLVYTCLIGVLIGVGFGLAGYRPGLAVCMLLIGWWLVGRIMDLNKKLIQLGLWLVVGMIIGWWRAALVFNQLMEYQSSFGQLVTIEGIVIDDTTMMYGGQSLKLSQIKLNQQSLPGRVLVSASTNVEIKRGDVVIVRGKLELGLPGYQASLRRLVSLERRASGAWSTMWRDALIERLDLFLSRRVSQLVRAIVFGQKTVLERELSDQIRTVGLSHIVVASGLHLMMIVGFSKRLLTKISRRWQVIGAWLTGMVFAMMAGLTASMVRALMAMSLGLVTWFVGRKLTGWRLILLLLAISLMFNPLAVRGDWSWWLSYSAFFGLLVALPVVEQFWFGDCRLNWLAKTSLAAVVIQIMVAPVLIVGFGHVLLIGVLSNLLIVPLLPIIMLLAISVVVLAPWSSLASLVASCLSWLIELILGLINLLSQLPLASLKLDLSLEQAIICGVGLVALVAVLALANYRYSNYARRVKCDKITS